MDAAGKSRVLTVPDDWLAEPVRVTAPPQGDELPRFQTYTTPAEYREFPMGPPPQSSGSKFVCGGYEVPIEDTQRLMAALTSRRSKCSGARARASRGRPVRRRGSRRTPAATRAGPDDGSGDPEPGSSSGHLDGYALAGGSA